jgi:hypothetical protein
MLGIVLSAHLHTLPATAKIATVFVADDVDGVSARVEIIAPTDLIWRAMQGCEGVRRFVTGLKSCVVKSPDAAGAFEVIHDRVERGWPVPLTSAFRQAYEPQRSIRVTRISGDLLVLDARWTLSRSGDSNATVVKNDGRVGIDTQVTCALSRPVIEAGFRNTLERMASELRRGPRS